MGMGPAFLGHGTRYEVMHKPCPVHQTESEYRETSIRHAMDYTLEEMRLLYWQDGLDDSSSTRRPDLTATNEGQCQCFHQDNSRRHSENSIENHRRGLFDPQAQADQRGGLFGPGGLFGQPGQPQANQRGGLFGQPEQPQVNQRGGLFGQPGQPQANQRGRLFGQPEPPQANQRGGLFGQPGQPQANHRGRLFGQPGQDQRGGIFGGQAQANQRGGLLSDNNSSEQRGNLFGNNYSAEQSGSLLGNNDTAEQSGNLFGNNNSPGQSGNLSGNNNSPRQSGNLFGNNNSPGQSGNLPRNNNSSEERGILFGKNASEWNISVANEGAKESPPSDRQEWRGLFGQRIRQTPRIVGPPQPADNESLESAIKEVRGLGCNIENECPRSLICPITCEIMKDPVMLSDGYNYECDAANRWLQSCASSPMTNIPLPSDQGFRNVGLRSEIWSWVRKQQERLK